MTDFVHLKVHSEYSLTDSTIRIPSLISSIKEKGFSSVAINDDSNLFAAIKFFNKSTSNGIKPIISADLNIFHAETNTIGKISLLVQNDAGYKNLMSLISQAYDERGGNEKSVVQYDWLDKHSEGLICLTGARHGSVGQLLIQNRLDQAGQLLRKFKDSFPNRLYVELQRTAHSSDNQHVIRATQKAIELDLPVVATNDVMFINRNEYEIHAARVAINRKAGLEQYLESFPDEYTEEQYLKSADEMSELFEDIPSAITNTVEIAKRCSLDIELGQVHLPRFSVPSGMSESSLLQEMAKQGLKERLSPEVLKSLTHTQDEYDKRLEYELNIINNMGFPGYFLIVADFIQWSKDNDIPVGPGRGSGAGSLVAYALGITEIDPLPYDLIFERFLNPERVSMPDFDIDFCMDNRDRVIQYVASKYGSEAVSQIITFGTAAAKAAIRDAGRTLGYGYGLVDSLSKLIPNDPGITIDKAFHVTKELQQRYDSESEAKKIIDLAKSIEGIVKNTGKHAGGVLISPSKLTDFTPTYRDPEVGSLVSQFDKDDVESAGLVKFDFLGLRTLTVVKNTMDQVDKHLSANGLDSFDINKIDLTDKATFDLLKRGDTTAVFQLESSGMKNLIKRLQPDNFEEIIALVALYRPGPLQAGMVDDFVNRKKGITEVEYPHPLLEPILKNTYGVFVYQEQVMKTAQVLAGYSLGQADMLRKAMGKKKPEVMEQQRSMFVSGSVENGLSEQKAVQIFDLMEKFAGYGFNKSHSAAYALISFQTAYLKTHYPEMFMSSVLSSDMDNTDKVVIFLDECRRMGLSILPPDINNSQLDFTVDQTKNILFGLGAVKGIGGSAIESILSERKERPFDNLFDFVARCNVTKSVIEAAIKSGAMDNMGAHRNSLMATYPKAIQVGKQLRKQPAQQSSLFGDIGTDPAVAVFAKTRKWTDDIKLSAERATLGLYLSGHPIDQFRNELDSFVTGTLAQTLEPELDIHVKGFAEATKDRKVRVAGQIIANNLRGTRKGSMSFLTIDDKTKQANIVVLPHLLKNVIEFLQPDTLVIIDGTLKYDDNQEAFKLIASDIKTLDTFREREVSSIMISMSKSVVNKTDLEYLKDEFKQSAGGLTSIGITGNDSAVRQLQGLLPSKITLSQNLINTINAILGEDSLRIIYKGSEKNASLEKSSNTSSVLLSTGSPDERQKRFELAFNDPVMA